MYVYIHMYIYTYIYMYIHIYTYMYIYRNMYIYMHIYIYTESLYLYSNIHILHLYVHSNDHGIPNKDHAKEKVHRVHYPPKASASEQCGPRLETLRRADSSRIAASAWEGCIAPLDPAPDRSTN